MARITADLGSDVGMNGIRVAAITFAEHAEVAFDFGTAKSSASNAAYFAEKLKSCY